MKITITILALSIPFITVAEDLPDKYNTEQRAVLYSTSHVCHAELVGGHYKSMKIKSDSGDKKYTSYETLRQCVMEGGRLDKRYSKRFPELALLETQILKEEKQSDLLALLATKGVTAIEIEKEQKSIEVVNELENIQQKKVDKIEEKKEKVAQDEYDFYGFNWAPGIAVMNYSSSYISDVRIESSGTGDDQINTVFIDKEVDTNIAIVLETHYLWEINKEFIDRRTGVGLFATTNLAKQEGNPLTVFGFGAMFAVKDKDSSNGFSVGLAYFIDTDFKELRDDLKDGSVTSYTDSSKIIRTVDESGWMLMISSKF